MISAIHSGLAALARVAAVAAHKLADRVLDRFSDFFVGPW